MQFTISVGLLVIGIALGIGISGIARSWDNDDGETPVVTLNRYQLQQAVEFIGVDDDSRICLKFYDHDIVDTKDDYMPKGLYVWLEDYADEGAMLLTHDEETAQEYWERIEQLEFNQHCAKTLAREGALT